MRVRYVMGALALASVVLLSAIGGARAADKWSVLGKQTLKSTETTAEIRAQRGYSRRTSRRRSSASRALMWRSRRSFSTGTIAQTKPSRLSES